MGSTGMRHSVALIYTAIAVIAASGAAILFRLTPLPLDMAVMFGAVLFFVMAVVDQAAARRNERKAHEQQIALNDATFQDLFNEVDMIRSRLVALETDTQQIVDQAVAPLHQDVQAVGALLAQVTEAVADNDHRLVELEEGLESGENLIVSAAQVEPQTASAKRASLEAMAAKPAAVAQSPVDDASKPAEAASDDEAGESDQESEPKARSKRRSRAAQTDEQKTSKKAQSRALIKRVTAAVENERIETALQSIVTLPHRRARGYATIFNLVLDGSGTLEAKHALPAVEAAGVSEAFDKAAMLRALALADRFAARESASMVFVPLSGSALMRSRFADWLVHTLTEEKELAGRLVLEIAQKDVRAFSPLDFDVMGTLADLGFRMCVSNLDDVRSDLFDLSSHGFRYAKAPVSIFLGSGAEARSDIHPEDLADLAARNGMDLIVDRVESEAQVVELLECKLRYAQGNLFARPRVVDIVPRPDKQKVADLISEASEAQSEPASEEPPAQRPRRPAAALSRSA